MPLVGLISMNRDIVIGVVSGITKIYRVSLSCSTLVGFLRQQTRGTFDRRIATRVILTFHENHFLYDIGHQLGQLDILFFTLTSLNSLVSVDHLLHINSGSYDTGIGSG